MNSAKIRIENFALEGVHLEGWRGSLLCWRGCVSGGGGASRGVEGVASLLEGVRFGRRGCVSRGGGGRFSVGGGASREEEGVHLEGRRGSLLCWRGCISRGGGGASRGEEGVASLLEGVRLTRRACQVDSRTFETGGRGLDHVIKNGQSVLWDTAKNLTAYCDGRDIPDVLYRQEGQVPE